MNPRITAETDLESVAFDRLAISAWGDAELSLLNIRMSETSMYEWSVPKVFRMNESLK